MADQALVETKALEQFLPLIASGKVRDLYLLDEDTLLFIATDRISAYDVIMKNGIPHKGALLTLLSTHWFTYLSSVVPGLMTHYISSTIPQSLLPKLPSDLASKLSHRSMTVRRLQIFPIESIVRGYITGSAWSEYTKSQTVCGMPIPAGLRESEAFPQPIWTPSTKAEVGGKDENIHPSKAAEMVGIKYAQRIQELSLQLYIAARDYALPRGVIIADTKFEFGLDKETDEVVLVDEVLTPDSSRFWPKEKYEVGRAQESFDKQYLRDWLTREGLKGKDGVEMPEEVMEGTSKRYREAFETLVGKRWEEAMRD